MVANLFISVISFAVVFQVFSEGLRFETDLLYGSLVLLISVREYFP